MTNPELPRKEGGMPRDYDDQLEGPAPTFGDAVRYLWERRVRLAIIRDGSRDPGLYVWLRGEVFVALPRPAPMLTKNPKGFEGSIKIASMET